jgi:ribosome biogenesis protein UTP30
MMGNGPVYSLKIGRISMDKAELVKNIMRSVFRTLPHILGTELTPKDLRQITIKTHNSPSLPIYNYLD